MAEPMTAAQRLVVRLMQGNRDDPNEMAKTDFGGRSSMGARFMSALSKWPVNSSLAAYSDEMAGRVTTRAKGDRR